MLLNTFLCTLVASAVTFCQQMPVQKTLSFSKTPGLIRVDENVSALFSWTVDNNPPDPPDHDTPNNTIPLPLGVSGIEYMYGNTKMCSFISDNIVGYPDYLHHVRCFKNATFELLRATEKFIEQQFSIDITVGNTSYHNSDAFLFIYRKPDVQIYNPSNITQGDVVNINCNATSTSLPAAHRLPITFKWTHHQQPIIDTSGSRFVIAGSHNGSLTITNIQGHQIDITCIAREYGSNLNNTVNVRLHVQECSSCEEDSTVIKYKTVWILSGLTFFIVAVMVCVIVYLVRKRRHKRLVFSGRPNSAHDSDDDSEQHYDVIRNSQIASVTIATARPILPEHDPKRPVIAQYDNEGYTYDYAIEPWLDAQRINIRTSPNRIKQIRKSGIYEESIDEERIRKDVDIYMAGADIELQKFDTDQYDVICQSPEAHSPALHADRAVLECHTCAPIEPGLTATTRVNWIKPDKDHKQESKSRSANERYEIKSISGIGDCDEYCMAGNLRNEHESIQENLNILAKADDAVIADTVRGLYDVAEAETSQITGVGLYHLSADENINPNQGNLYSLADGETETVPFENVYKLESKT